jgi:hypothetical protein
MSDSAGRQLRIGVTLGRIVVVKKLRLPSIVGMAVQECRECFRVWLAARRIELQRSHLVKKRTRQNQRSFKLFNWASEDCDEGGATRQVLTCYSFGLRAVLNSSLCDRAT